ncbi:MAG: hypothetical protein MJ058_03065 [Akkermansia sp.]|nr:hypothetical protein [Akkermansia sp.]
MKALAITLLGLAMLAGPAMTPAFAKVHYPQGNLAAEDSDKEDSDAESAKPTKVGEALKKCGYLTDVRPRAAEVYFIFHARKDSEEGDILAINKTYKKMLRDKTVEVVMVSEDQDTTDMKEWTVKEKVLFAIMSYQKVSQELPYPYKRPANSSLPVLVVMDANGKKIDQATGPGEVLTMFNKWKKMVHKYKAKKAKAGKF